MNRGRRDVLQQGANVGLLSALVAVGLVRPEDAFAQDWKVAFETKSMADTIKALGGTTTADSKDITITAPDIAENGAVVPVGAATTLPGVKRMLLLVEKNPSVLTAAFDVSDAIDASFTTRVKMGQSSDIYAIAVMNDGKLLYAKKEVKVTLGGCGG